MTTMWFIGVSYAATLTVLGLAGILYFCQQRSLVRRLRMIEQDDK